MKLTGIHLLLTFQCTSACDHCFVWGSPHQSGTMTLGLIREILGQAKDLGTVRSIYFEGGEPFIYFPVLSRGVREAAEAGYGVGLVTNAYWATASEDADEWLRPLAGKVLDLAVSSDQYHESEPVGRQAMIAKEAAGRLGIALGIISIAQPTGNGPAAAAGQLPEGESAVMYRGRAAVRLAVKAVQRPRGEFTECPHEDLVEPGRLHIDPFGNVHICQGISVGNILKTPLAEISGRYEVGSHPVTGPLQRGGPVELARCYGLPRKESYADACHMCYETRLCLRSRLPDVLAPDQMYGAPDEDTSPPG